MCKLFSILFMAFLLHTSSAGAQNALQRFYTQYKDNANTQQITIPRPLLRLCAGDPDLREISRYLKSLKIFLYDKLSMARDNVSMALSRALDQDGFERLLEIADGTDQIRIFAREEKDIIRALLVVVDSGEEMVVIQSNTHLSYAQLGDLLEGVRSGDAHHVWRQWFPPKKGLSLPSER